MHTNPQIDIDLASHSRLQTRTAKALLNDSGICSSIQYHGSIAFYCFDTVLLDTRRPCRDGLGESMNLSIWKTLADSLSRVRLSWLTRATLQGADRVAGWLAASVFIFIVGLAMVCRVHRLSRPVHQSDNR